MLSKSLKSFKNKSLFQSLQRATFATSKKQDVTPSTLRASGQRMLDYYVATQEPSGKLKGLDDTCHYCKLPHALVMGGRVDEADRMLDFCVSTFLQKNGDFMNTKSDPDSVANPVEKTLHWEFADFYPYLNQWWITCGIRLNRFDFTSKAYEYVDKYWYNPKVKAGIVQDPIGMNRMGRDEHCIFTSAHIGLTQLFMGNIDKSKALGDTINKMIKKQPSMDKNIFYQRFDENYNIFTEFDKNDDGVKLAAIVDGNKPLQCWWSLGYPAAYSALLYLNTGDKKYLESAEMMLQFAAKCNENIRNNIVAHKVMWAASLVGNITGKKIYWDLCKDIASHIINVGQVDDGRVLNWEWKKDSAYGDAQVIDQTGEIAYWFFVVARQMEKAELGGRLS